jgi:phosphoribosyl 1,2-cyclic phosphodiesterase
MLLRTNRPQSLKDRILSDHGHLCNEDSAFAALELIGDNTKEIVLAHLSEEANTPETAIKAWKNIFQYKGVNFDKYNIRCAHQRIPLIGGSGYED